MPLLVRAWRQCDRVRCAALCLTVLGWSLAWASALEIVPPLPGWIAIAAFVLGLALIPFARSGDTPRNPDRKEADARPAAGGAESR